MRLRDCLIALALLLTVTGGGVAGAVEPNEILDDPALEARARELSKGIRCLVCQNESIDSSNADLARELRLLVRERLVAGDSDNEVLSYLVERYGDFVLLEPPVKPGTYLLWFGPAAMLVIGGLAVMIFLRGQRKHAVAAQPLSTDEQARVAKLLEEQEPENRP